jgi:hypothetical protein
VTPDTPATGSLPATGAPAGGLTHRPAELDDVGPVTHACLQAR